MWRDIKGIYDMVTTFMFVMVVVFIVLAVLFIGKVIKSKTAETTDESNKYEDITDAKDRILSNSCHGIVIDEATANITCEMPAGKIRGYIIEMPVYGNCTDTAREWRHIYIDDQNGEHISYFVAIKKRDTGIICPGKLKVIY